MGPKVDPKPASPPVTTRLGDPPRLWPGSTVFFADLYAIFYGEPEKTRQLQQSVSGFYGYGGRLIPILDLLYGGGNNLLVLHEAPDGCALDYFGDRLGLSLPRIEVLDHNLYPTFHEALARRPEVVDMLRRHPVKEVDGYVTDEHLERIAAQLGKRVLNPYHASRDANDKILLNTFLDQAELPLFDGGKVCRGDSVAACLDALAAKGYRRAVIRSSLGASGFGVATMDLKRRNTADLPRHLMSEACVLIHGWVEPGVLGVEHVTSPSVQFFIGDDHVTLFDLTGQLLRDASIHEGNVAPPMDLSGDTGVMKEILAQAEEVARWVRSTGYRGTGSIDFLVYLRNGAVAVNVCEVNARVTGATYPALLARHFQPGRAWLMRNFSFAPRLSTRHMLDHLEREGMLFLPERDEGVLPINCIRNDAGKVVKCQLLFLSGQPERCADMMEACLNLLPTEGSYDRD